MLIQPFTVTRARTRQAFTATALLEEQRCIDDPHTCGYEPSTLSPLDVSRVGWKLDTSGQFGGGLPYNALREALRGGVCLDHYAPFIEGSKLSCSITGFFGSGDQPCLVSKLWDIFTTWRVRTTGTESGASCSARNEDELQAIYRDLLPQLRELLPRTAALGVDFYKALSTAKDQVDFLDKLFLTPACKESRFKFIKPSRTLSAQTFRAYGKNTAEKAAELVKILSTGHSVGLSFCVGGIVWPSFKACPTEPKEYSKASGHAIVIDGMHFNESMGRCEIHVRNSWGDSSAFNGWYGLEQAAPSFEVFDHIGEESK